MEKLETNTCTIENVTHHFYCDDCNKYLGETEEYDDGYYHELGEFELSFYFLDNRYEINKCLCDECREKFLNKMLLILTELGFKPLYK
jgi:hypothetical protein